MRALPRPAQNRSHRPVRLIGGSCSAPGQVHERGAGLATPSLRRPPCARSQPLHASVAKQLRLPYAAPRPNYVGGRRPGGRPRVGFSPLSNVGHYSPSRSPIPRTTGDDNARITRWVKALPLSVRQTLAPSFTISHTPYTAYLTTSCEP